MTKRPLEMNQDFLKAYPSTNRFGEHLRVENLKLFAIRNFTALLLSSIAPAYANAQTSPSPAPSPSVSPQASAPAPAPTPHAWLDARVRAEAAHFNGSVYVFAKNLDTGATYSLNGDARVRTASAIKIAVMIETYARVSEGKAKWTEELTLTKEKKVGGSGVLPEMSDGLKITLRDAVNLMMTLSDNTATNLIIDRFSADAVNERMASLGLKDVRLMRKVFGGGESAEGKREENKRFGLGRASPFEMVKLMEMLERGEIVNAEASKEMLELMKREQNRDGIGRTLSRTPKATKSGALDALRSDVGVIYTTKGRIAMAITCDDMPEPEWTVDNAALQLMSRLSLILIEGLGKR